MSETSTIQSLSIAPGGIFLGYHNALANGISNIPTLREFGAGNWAFSEKNELSLTLENICKAHSLKAPKIDYDDGFLGGVSRLHPSGERPGLKESREIEELSETFDNVRSMFAEGLYFPSKILK